METKTPECMGTHGYEGHEGNIINNGGQQQRQQQQQQIHQQYAMIHTHSVGLSFVTPTQWLSWDTRL